MQISPYLILICALIVVILLAIIATRKNMDRLAARDVFEVLILTFFALSFFGLSLLITNEEIRFTLHELKFLPLSFVAPCSLMVYREFIEKPFKHKTKLLLCIIPVISVILALTNNLHHFFRAEMLVLYHNGVSYVDSVPAWGYWLYSTYSYALFVAGICILAVHYFKKPRIYRGQIGLMIFTASAAVFLSLAVMIGSIPDYGDIALIACSTVVIVQYITIVNYSYSNMRLKAWSLIVGELDDIVMIFDHDDQLIDSNADTSRFSCMIKHGAEYLANPDIGVDESLLVFPDSREHYKIYEKRLFDKKDRYTGRVLVIKDVSDQENAASELEYITTHDYLTGLKNRLAFLHQLQEIKHLPTALICVNIQGMKIFNNIFGNEYGDRVIIRVAKELNQLTGENDFCMRLGGDEMGVILANTDQTQAEVFISKLKEVLLSPPDTYEISLETSYAIVNDINQNPQQLFADIAGTMRKGSGLSLRPLSCGIMEPLRQSLSQLLDDTGERTRKIKELCVLSAERLGLSQIEKEKLQLLCDMMDIGLISIDPAILKSKGNLSNEQWSEWKLHTIKGYNIALSIQQLSGIANEILSHHERFDGYGYPDRLKGDDIPIAARILSAVEFFVDTPAEKAATLLMSRSGTQFDPRVTEAILSLECQ